jgi:hypothetical protein
MYTLMKTSSYGLNFESYQRKGNQASQLETYFNALCARVAGKVGIEK